MTKRTMFPGPKQLLAVAAPVAASKGTPAQAGRAFAARVVASLKGVLGSPAELAAAFDVTRGRVGGGSGLVLDASSRDRVGRACMLDELTDSIPAGLDTKDRFLAFAKAASVRFGKLAQEAGWRCGEMKIDAHFEGEELKGVRGVVIALGLEPAQAKARR